MADFPKIKREEREEKRGISKKIRRSYKEAQITNEKGEKRRLLHFIYAALVFFFAFIGLALTIRALSQEKYIRSLFGLVQLGLFTLAFLMIRRVIKARRWVAIASFLAGFLLFIPLSLGPGLSDMSYHVYVWPDGGLSSAIVQPPSPHGILHMDSPERFVLTVYELSEEEGLAYIQANKDMGFTYNPQEDDDHYMAYNEQGLLLILNRYPESNQLSISLYSAREFGPLEWPQGPLALLLPVPDYRIGEVESDTTALTAILVAETTEENYDLYVERCIEAGFSEILNRRDDFFDALDESGHYLSVRYQDFRVMNIRIHRPGGHRQDNQG